LSPEAIADLTDVIRKWVVKPSVIKPKLRQLSNRSKYTWRIQLVDEVDDDTSKFYNQRFEDCIEWTDTKLTNWKNVARMSFDMWDFKHHHDAEKFITLFHLSWDQ
jgi:hypothetical protein